MKRIGHYLKTWLGFETFTPYDRAFFTDSNMDTCRYLAAMTVAMEIWMVFYQIKRFVQTDAVFTLGNFWAATKNYWVLMAVALIVLLYSCKFLYGKNANRTIALALVWLYAIVLLGFGMYVSYHDMAAGKQILSFMTMTFSVGCLLVWRPYFSILFLGGVFLLFYHYMKIAAGGEVRSGDRINYFIYWFFLTVLSISIYHQRLSESRKSEHLEETNRSLHHMAITDDLTQIYNMTHFVMESGQRMRELGEDLKNYVFLFINIRSFSNYNEKYGHEEGNRILKMLAKRLTETAGDAGVVARQADDHFVAFVPRTAVEDIKKIHEELWEIDPEVRMGLKIGIYQPEDDSINPTRACDCARYACSTLRKYYERYSCEYDSAMERAYRQKRYIIHHLDEAIANGYIMPYYQPVVWADGRKLCGFEALSRWVDPQYGFLSPAAFVPTLEEYREIHKLDRYIVERVCQDLAESDKKGREPIPVSINFSRLDFELGDCITHLVETMDKYGLSHDRIHVEVTESALTEYHDLLEESMAKLHGLGFSLWLDDFGSGYSALNVLKDYDFDVLKIDMAFLSNFGTNDKTRPILRSVVAMANAIGIATLTEGVESEDEANFLEEIGCGRLQGYYYGKPLPYDQTCKRIQDGELIVADSF
ncbi:MAG: EAL domain-containing protein [Lachnospiraceae bacterium]|nr:EAL domain-containing protein [Lachnospiraceae bacterium]